MHFMGVKKIDKCSIFSLKLIRLLRVVFSSQQTTEEVMTEIQAIQFCDLFIFKRRCIYRRKRMQSSKLGM